MDERDSQMAPWREQLWLTVLILSASGGVFLGIGLLIAGWADQLEFKYICDADNCVVDRRPWVQRRAVPITAFIGCVIAFCVALPAVRRERAAGKHPHKSGPGVTAGP